MQRSEGAFSYRNLNTTAIENLHHFKINMIYEKRKEQSAIRNKSDGSWKKQRENEGKMKVRDNYIFRQWSVIIMQWRENETLTSLICFIIIQASSPWMSA